MRRGLLCVVRFSLQESWSMTTGLDWGSPWGWHWELGQMCAFHHSLFGFWKDSCIGRVYSLSPSLPEGQTGKKPRDGRPPHGLLLFYISTSSLRGAWEAHACITEDNFNDFDLSFHCVGTERNLKLPSLEANAFGWGISPPLMDLWGGKHTGSESFLIHRHCDVDSLPWCWTWTFLLIPTYLVIEKPPLPVSLVLCIHVYVCVHAHTCVCTYMYICVLMYVCACTYMCVCTYVRAWVGQRLWLLFLRYNPPYFSESILSLTRTC